MTIKGQPCVAHFMESPGFCSFHAAFMQLSAEQPWILQEFNGLQNKQPEQPVDRQVNDSTSSGFES